MKITRVETIPVQVPIDQGRAVRGGRGAHTVSPFLLVRLHTDEGPIGLGEVSCTPIWSGEDQVTAAHCIEAYLAPQIVGADPTEVDQAGDVLATLTGAVDANHVPDPSALQDPEVAASYAQALAEGTLARSPAEAWGNAAIEGFGIGQPVRPPELVRLARDDALFAGGIAGASAIDGRDGAGAAVIDASSSRVATGTGAGAFIRTDGSSPLAGARTERSTVLPAAVRSAANSACKS